MLCWSRYQLGKKIQLLDVMASKPAKKFCQPTCQAVKFTSLESRSTCLSVFAIISNGLIGGSLEGVCPPLDTYQLLRGDLGATHFLYVKKHYHRCLELWPFLVCSMHRATQNLCFIQLNGCYILIKVSKSSLDNQYSLMIEADFEPAQ